MSSQKLIRQFHHIGQKSSKLSHQALQQLFENLPSHHKLLEQLNTLQLNVTARFKLLKANFEPCATSVKVVEKLTQFTHTTFLWNESNRRKLQPFSPLKLFNGMAPKSRVIWATTLLWNESSRRKLQPLSFPKLFVEVASKTPRDLIHDFFGRPRLRDQLSYFVHRIYQWLSRPLQCFLVEFILEFLLNISFCHVRT